MAMSNRLLELKDTLQEFVDQSEHFALCLDTRDDDLLYVHKMLLALDREQPADIVLSFAKEFESEASWVDYVISNIATQIESTNGMIVESGEAERQLARLPAEASDPGRAPALRLRAAMDHVVGLLPVGDHRAVWGLLPVSIADRHGYARLLGQLLPVRGLAPWMKRHRIIFRDDRARPFMQQALATSTVSHVLTYFIDLSPEAFSSDLAEQAADPEAPEEERMQALMQLAGHDFAHGRSSQAIEKYGVLYSFYERRQVPEMQALCLAGVAEVLAREGRIPEAKAKYQQGLALAVPAKSIPVLLNLLIGAGACSMQLEQWDEAEGYYTLANEAAGKAFNPFCKCDCLEQIGVARLGQGKQRGAMESWNLALGLCAQAQYYPRQRSVLERMTVLYRNAGMAEETQACEAALADARRLEQAWTGAQGA